MSLTTRLTRLERRAGEGDEASPYVFAQPDDVELPTPGESEEAATARMWRNIHRSIALAGERWQGVDDEPER